MDNQGRLIAGQVLHWSPVAYQSIRGQRVDIPASLVSLGNSEYAFRLGAYDHSHDLVIDPVIEFATVSGGSGEDQIVGTVPGFRYGTTTSADWNRLPDTHSRDIFVQTGNETTGIATVFWGGSGDEQIGGSDFETVNGILFLAGTTSSPDAPTTSDPWIPGRRYAGGETDGFLLILHGAFVSYAGFVGGPGADRLYDLRKLGGTGSDVNFVVAGQTNNPQWPDATVTRSGSGGAADAIVGLVTASTLRLSVIGGGGDDRAMRIRAAGPAAWSVAGETTSGDFPAFSGETAAAGQDLWAGILRRDTLEPTALRLFGGPAAERFAGLSFYAGEALYLAGTTGSAALPAAVDPYHGGDSDAFLARLHPASLEPLSTRYFGGEGTDEFHSLEAVNGDLFLAGSTDSTELALPNLEPHEAGGGLDAFFLLCDPVLNPMRGARFGGPGTDRLLAAFPAPEPSPYTTYVPTPAKVKLAGATDSSEWLASIDPHAKPGGAMDGFELTLAYSGIRVNTEPGLFLGQHLQTPFYVHAFTEPGTNGLVRVRSSDPAKLIMAASWGAQGVDELIVSTVDGREPQPLFLYGLSDSGDVDLILSGTGPSHAALPERRYRVHLAPSAIFRSTADSVRAYAGSEFPVGLFYGPLLPDGTKGTAQSLRPGLQAPVTVSASDASALQFPVTPLPTPTQPSFSTAVRFNRNGAFKVSFDSPLIHSGPDQELSVNVISRPLILGESQIQLVKDHTYSISFSLAPGDSLTFASDNPARLAVRLPNSVNGGSATVAYQDKVSSIILTALDQQASAALRVQGTYQGKSVDESLRVYLIPYRVAVRSSRVTAVTSWPFVVGVERTPLPPLENAGIPMAPLLFRTDGFSPRFLVSDPGILGYVSYDYYNFTFYFNTYRQGRATIRFDVPGFPEFSYLSIEVEVVPPSLRYLADRITIPAGTSIYLDSVYSNIPNTFGTISNLRLRLSEGAPFLLSQHGVTGTDITVPYGPGARPSLIARDAVPGQSATLYLSSPTTQEIAVPIHTIEAVVRPGFSEIRVSPSSETRTIPLKLVGHENGIVSSGATYGVSFSRALEIPVVVNPPGVCDIPAVLRVREGDGYLSLSYTCSSPGEVTVTLQSSALSAAQSKYPVRIISAPEAVLVPSNIPKRILLGNGLQTPLVVEQFISVNNRQLRKVTSGAPQLLRVSVNEATAGTAEVTLPNPWSPVYVQGYASEGTTQLELEFTDGYKATVPVFLFPSTIAVRQSGLPAASITAIDHPLSVPKLTLDAVPFLVDPVSQRLIPTTGLQIRGGTDPFFARGQSTDLASIEPAPPDALFQEGAASAKVGYRAKALGQAVLYVSQPEGFITVPDSGLIVTVVERSLHLGGEILLAANLQRGISIAGNPTPTGPVTVTSLDPDKLLVSGNGLSPGQASTVSAGNYLYLQALETAVPGATARVRLEAPGFATSEETLYFYQAGFQQYRAEESMRAGDDNGISLSFGPINPRGNSVEPGYTVRPGATLNLKVTSSNPTVLEVPQSSVRIESSTRIPLRALHPGKADLILEAPPGIVLRYPTVKFTVANYQFGYLPSPPGAAFLVSTFTIVNPRDMPTPITVSSTSGVPLRFGTQPSGPQAPSTSSITLDFQPREIRTLYFEPVSSGNQTTAVISAPETDSFTAAWYLSNPLLVFSPAGPLTFDLSGGSATVAVALGIENYSSAAAVLGTSMGTLKLQLQSSNDQVVRVPQGPVELEPGRSRVSIPLQFTGKGDAIISFASPPGFNGTLPRRDLLITVR